MPGRLISKGLASSVTEAALYPGVGLLETTNVSVGRGTDAPFEQFGAPWLDGSAVAEALNALAELIVGRFGEEPPH